MSTTDREQLELLISRIADGEASRSDWDAFSAFAEREPTAWKELASAQRDHAALSLAVGVALHGADRVDLPSREMARRWSGQDGAERAARWSRLRTAGGWAVAACLALVMASGRLGVPIVSNTSGGNGAGMIPAGYTINNPDDAVQAYLDVGKKTNVVLGELPQRLLVESRPAANGRVEVIYVRQFVERAEVNDLMRFGQDEAGRPVPVRVAVPKAQRLPD